MSIQKYKPEQIVTFLLQIEVQMANGGTPRRHARKLGFTPRVAGRMSERRDFYSLKETQIVIEQLRQEYNTRRSHSALSYSPPGYGIFPAGPLS